MATDCAAVSASMAVVARSRFKEFRMWDGDTIGQTQNLFDQVVNECIIPALAISEEKKTMVLPTHPTEKWRTYTDVHATQNSLSSVDVILRAMKALKERWNTRNDWSIGEANYMGRGGGGGSGDGYKPKTGGTLRC